MLTSLPVRRPLNALALRPSRLRRLMLRPISLAACLVAGTPIAFGLPQGALPTFGQTLVKQTNAQRIDITQTSQRAGLDWTSFSIGSNERVVVSQPDRSSVLLNRVVGNDPSQPKRACWVTVCRPITHATNRKRQLIHWKKVKTH